MKAVKANKEYTVTEEDKGFYVKQGFDIVDDDGNVLEYGKGKKVDYEEYLKLVRENETLHAEVKELETALEESTANSKETGVSTPKKASQKKVGE